MSSNVGQSYPYTSESVAERAQAVTAIIEAHPELADKIAAETTPLDPTDGSDRWWVWKCPTRGCPGLLHVTGYALDKHALYVACDGTCALTFLR
ncbi:MAG: hypothetical protein ACXWWR_00590 [Candidatus Limnocylindrales bacterium]